MSKIVFRSFGGEIPRLPAHLLPEGASQDATNCDLAHGDLRGLRSNKTLASNLVTAIQGRAITSVYTEDGVDYFAWAYDTYAVKSQVVDDKFYRVFYTQVLDDGPIIKVARTWRNDSVNPPTKLIGTSAVLGNYQPPENSNPPPVGIAGPGGPDSWVLGVPPPRVQGVADTDKLEITLSDLPEWPGIPRLSLRVMYFLENPTGQIVAQLDISNNETANRPNPADNIPHVPWVHNNVFVTNVGYPNALRQYKIQDLLSSLGATQRPYKYYFFIPPDLDTVPIARTVIIVNNSAAADIILTYGSTPVADPTPLPPDPGGGQGSGASDGGSAVGGGGSTDPAGGDVGDSDGTGDGGDSA